MITTTFASIKLDETYVKSIDENAPARTVRIFVSGETNHPKGISQPMSTIMHPTYIIISAKIENIRVAMGAKIENPSKVKVDTKIVELIANTDVINASFRYL